MALFSKILGDPNERAVNKLRPIVEEINGLEEKFKAFSDAELRAKTGEFQKRLKEKETLDDILPEAYAAVRETALRTLNQRHYDVQLMGGIVLHEGKIAEMRTGEGKTLASTSAVYLNALEGRGVHVVTVNDYLSRRDAVWMGQIYAALGLSVGAISHDSAFVYDPEYKIEDKEDLEEKDEERDMTGSFRIQESFLRPVGRGEAYKADVTYGTNNEFGFDYLRDNLVQKIEDKVQRDFNYAIVDEVDSILIDEARTPLIISAPGDESTDLYSTFSQIVPMLKEGSDYNVDYKIRAVSITEDGISKVEKKLGMENIYDPAEGGGIRYVHNLEQALKAQIIFTRDKDYVVKNGEVIIVDEFTGRMMPGRRYSEGLHQAIEAKENVSIQKESRTLASISFQNYFRMYKKLGGMTGTAVTSAEEFDRVYKLEITVVPTNKPAIRNDLRDFVFRTEKGRLAALVREIKSRNEKGQPVLIGTTSIEKNEYVSKLLNKEGIQHELLNAKNHTREGEIIAQAGRMGAVTIATNMAGRGVDIILGGNPINSELAQKVKDVGGLHVIGTERHEARRIDNQLRGRAGRQGDPGSTQFYLSLEDNLMRVFGGERIEKMMKTLKMPEDQPLESKLVSGAIEGAQGKIEGMNFDTRKHLLDYDEVMNKQRHTIYKKRNEILKASPTELQSIIEGYIENYLDELCEAHMGGQYSEDWNMEEVFEDLKTITPLEDSFHKKLQDLSEKSEDKMIVRDDIREFISDMLYSEYEKKEKEVGEEKMGDVQRWALLRTVDVYWMDNLDAMEHLRDSVRLRAYAQRDPLVEYKNESIKMFTALLDSIERGVVTTIFKVSVSADHSNHNHATQRTARNIIAEAKKFKNKDGKEIGRNDPCHCGSGKKYKKCHGK